MIDEVISTGIDYLRAQSLGSLATLFWFVLLFEIPRYLFSFVASAFFVRSAPTGTKPPDLKVSVLIAGHNEENAVERCVKSLQEQSQPPDEVIFVSDGSTDGMRAKLRAVMKAGLVDQAHCTELRAGKSAGVNLAGRQATGDILINIDCDCTFDRDAFKNLIEPFSNPNVGAVCGNILVRNQAATVVTAFQAIEYLISISLGKRAAALTDQVTCVSGAFGAFRREAFSSVHGLDAGGGEDLDITLKLRRNGWKVNFAAEAICYTDAPSTVPAFVRQRLRWERDAVRLRYRKHRDLLNPFSKRFRLSELAHEVEYLLFNVIGAIILPVYFFWLFAVYGALAPVIIVAAQFGLFFLELTVFALAAWATPKAAALRLAIFVPGYSLFYGVFVRFVRLFAYLQEWVFHASYRDAYVPSKVQRVRF